MRSLDLDRPDYDERLSELRAELHAELSRRSFRSLT